MSMRSSVGIGLIAIVFIGLTFHSPAYSVSLPAQTLSCSVASIYLPQITHKYYSPSTETEPNNTFSTADGMLQPSKTYYGYPNDEYDIFFVDIVVAGILTIDLQNYTGHESQLQLIYESGPVRKEYDYEPPYHIEYNVQEVGRYYISIYARSGYNQLTPYSLTITYPTLQAATTPIPTCAPPVEPNPPSGYLIFDDFETIGTLSPKWRVEKKNSGCNINPEEGYLKVTCSGASNISSEVSLEPDRKSPFQGIAMAAQMLSTGSEGDLELNITFKSDSGEDIRRYSLSLLGVNLRIQEISLEGGGWDSRDLWEKYLIPEHQTHILQIEYSLEDGVSFYKDGEKIMLANEPQPLPNGATLNRWQIGGEIRALGEEDEGQLQGKVYWAAFLE